MGPPRVLVATVAAVLAAGCQRSQVAGGLLESPGSMRYTLAAVGDIGLEPPPPQLRQVNLPSGLRLGFEAAPTRGMVGVVLLMGLGSAVDPPGKEGLAHLVEHLAFHARFDGRPLDEVLARLGAAYNANTTSDRTEYHVFAPASALPVLLRIMGQLVDQPLQGVDKHAFAAERPIVENELHQRTETAVYGQVAAWIDAAMFPPDHPYARPVGGTLASLRALTLDDARAFVHQPGYGPRNATLLVMGEIDPAAAAAAAERDLPAALVGDRQHPVAPVLTAAQPPPRYLPPPPAAGFATMAAPVAWPEIWLCYFLADLYGPYAPMMKVLTTDVVGRTLRERLIDDPDVGDVDLQTITYRQATVLACRITLLSSGRRREIAEKARAVIASLWRSQYTGEVGDPRLSWDATRMALAEAILEAEPFTGRALARAEFFHMTGAIGAYDALIGAVAVLRPELVAQHGTYLLGADRARLLFVDPLTDEARPLPGAVGVASLASRRLPDAPARGLDFGDPPRAAPVPELKGTSDFTLPNGLHVLLVRRPQFPSVTAALGFGGGAGASPPGILELLRLLERDGTFEVRQNAMEIQKADGADMTADLVVTGRRNVSNALVMLALRLRALDRLHWPKVMEELQHPRVPDHETLAKEANRAFWRGLYGTHPYGRVP
jgi:zinc protease